MRLETVARPELGAKRHCSNCGAKYYDLNRDPITCPKCGTVYEVATLTRVRPEVAAPHLVPAAAEEAEDIADVDVDAGEPELVPLEDADEETVGTAKAVASDEDEDLEIDEDLGGDEEEFLEEEEDEDDDVADLIEGDVEDEDES